MAPAGSFESLAAAIKAGADSVYFGVDQLNMRSRSQNFSFEDINRIAATCRQSNVRSYIALNTILYDHDMKLMRKIIDAAKNNGITAIIATDMAAITYAREKGIEVHASTQLNISNVRAVEFFARYIDVAVLARELTLKQIEKINAAIREKDIRGPNGALVQTELFVHGALCVSIAGKCYMSLAAHNSSANRGACFQPCRKSYRVIDEESGNELAIDNKFVMSPKDLEDLVAGRLVVDHAAAAVLLITSTPR